MDDVGWVSWSREPEGHRGRQPWNLNWTLLLQSPGSQDRSNVSWIPIQVEILRLSGSAAVSANGGKTHQRLRQP